MSSAGGDASPPPLFGFVQFEFPWELGPAAGRYVLRDSAAEADLRVLVLAIWPAHERRLLRGRRSKKAEPERGAAPVGTTRATLIRGIPLASNEEGKAWIAGAKEHVADELRVLNDIVQAHRIAAANHAVRPVALEQATAVRVGFGRGEQVAEGRWTEAIEPPPEQLPIIQRPSAALRPQERLAALLGGRDAALAAEELTLRARSDLDGGRFREAALELRVALEAALAELVPWSEQRDLAERIEELREERGSVGAAANAALQGGLDDETVADVERIVGRLEAAMRARAAG